MTAITLDEKYKELIDSFSTLNDKLNKFINGSPSETVSIEGGSNIKTISGLASDLKSFKYVQRVINHRLYSDMLADTIEDGMLIRVWGNDSLNGLYKKDGVSYQKVSYSDLYDLRDYLPNPWNYSQVKKNSTEFNAGLDILSYKVINSNLYQTNPRVVKGSALYSIDSPTIRGSFSFDFTINTVTGSGGNESKFLITLSNQVKLAVDDDFNDLVMPEIGLSSISDSTYTTYTVSSSAFKTPNGQADIPGTLEINFYHVDDSYKIIS